MSCYSLDLRQKVVLAYQQGSTSIRKLAQQFTMSPATVHKLIQQYQKTQDLNPKKPGAKKTSKLEEHREFILTMVENYPDWTLQQYSDYLVENRQVEASLSTLCRFLQKERLTLKKKTYRSETITTEAGQQQRVDYWEKVREIAEEDLIFLDETGFWVGMSRYFSRSLEGKKAYGLRKFYKGRKLTLIGAITIEGIVAFQIIEGSMKGEDFYEFIQTKLVPNLRQGQVIVMDNLRIHKMEMIEELILSKGARVIYLSPYSPEFNPIEMLWSTLKAFVRQFTSNSIQSLRQLIEMGLWLMEKTFFRNWFVKCCYCSR